MVSYVFMAKPFRIQGKWIEIFSEGDAKYAKHRIIP